MHEFSIAHSLLDSCGQFAKTHNAQKIDEVHIKIGVFSGVEPKLLKRAFDACKNATICQDAKLIIKTQNLTHTCPTCSANGELSVYTTKCPKCGAITQITDSLEMYLMSLVMQ